MKRQWSRNEKLNNKGFSLVEVLVCISILSVVTSAVFAFMMVGNRIFNKVNLEIDMQSEAQILKNYMNDLITDTAIGVQFYDGTEIGDAFEDNLFEADNCLVVYGENSISYLAWVESSKQVHFLEKGKDSFSVDENGQYQVQFSEQEKNANNWSVIANYVADFQCYLDNLKEEHRIFCVKMGFELQNVDYSTTHVITLRNEIFYDGKIDNYYDEEMGAYEDQITRITLNPGSTDKAIDKINGTTVTYTHTVLAIGEIDKDVIYSVEGNSSLDTRMQDNVLYIAPNETSSTLTVICKAKADENVSTTAIVNLASVSAINIIAVQEPNYNKMYYYPKTVVDFKAVVEGDFITQDGSGVIWELDNGDSSAKIVEMTQTTCKVNVGNEMNRTIVLRAISKVDPNVVAEYVIRTADIEIGELYITAQDGMYVVKRGDSLQLQVLVNGQNMQSGMNAKWRIVDSPLPNEELSIDQNGKINASIEIPYNKEYQFTVEVTVTDERDGGKKKTTTCAILMDKVHISFEPGYAIVVANNGSYATRLKMYIEGLNVGASEISIQQRPYVKWLQHWTAADVDEPDCISLALNMKSEKVITEYNTLRASLKGHSSVYTDLPVYYYKWNMIYNGKQVYIPLPGDHTNLVADENNDGIPDTQKEIKLNNITYGYKNITVNGIMCQYYVDKNNAEPDTEWFLRVGSNNTRYCYDEEKAQFVSQTQ